jgi:hypothetical protein
MVKTPVLIVASLVLLGAGAAAAQSMLAGPSPGLSVGGGSVVAQTSPTTTTTTPSTVGPSTGTPGTAGTTGTTTGTTAAPTTGTTTTGAPTTGTTTGTTANGTVTAATPGALAIDQVVAITRSVSPGAPVTVFTVPAGRQLVITDLLVTNPGAAAACGAQVGTSGTATTGTGTPATGATASDSGTGVLCVPAQTSLNLGLTTGLEFGAGQSVVLGNAVSTTETATPATLHYHLRGFLMSAS